ncbi:MAG: LysR family transcriptional regulator [Parvibaculum sp.]
MSNSEPDWALYRSFLAVIRQGSLSGAASALRMTQPTLGRHIDALEEALGTPLFTRSRMGLAPTDAALELLPHAQTMAAAAQALMRTASGEADEARGTVRLTTSEIMGAEVLPPIIARFRELHPKIEIELNLDDQQQNLLRRDADIALRMARPVQEALIVTHVGNARVNLYAHRAYLDRHPLPGTIHEIGDHSVIGYDENSRAIDMVRQAGINVTPQTFAVRSDSELAQLALLRAGAGIGGCQAGIAKRDPNLLPVFHDTFEFIMEMWLAYHEGLRTSRRVRLLCDHLAGELRTYATANKP